MTATPREPLEAMSDADLFNRYDETMEDWQSNEGPYNPAYKSELLRRLKERDALLAQQQWRPIESAPRDGSHIQLYRPEIQFVGYYAAFSTKPEVWAINAPGLPSMDPLPTHWRPLPPPPEEKGG